MFDDSYRRVVRAAGRLRPLACALLLTASALPALAQTQGPGPVPRVAKRDLIAPVYRFVESNRVRGPVIVTIPVAYVFGGGASASPAFCSPTIRAINSSNLSLQELVIGIDYRAKSGAPAGRTVTRFANIKIDRQDAYSFYQLGVAKCDGLEGTLTVIQCLYASGEDCAGDVKPVEFGAIPLTLKQP